MIACPECGQTDDFATYEEVDAVSYLNGIEDDGSLEFFGETRYFDSETKTDGQGNVLLQCRSCGVDYTLVQDLVGGTAQLRVTAQ